MVSVGAGAQAEVSEKIRTLGANLLLVMPGARNSGGARLESGTQPTLTEEDAAAIRRELVDAQVAAPLLSRSKPLVAANKNWVTLVAGINADYLVAREWQVADGRTLRATRSHPEPRLPSWGRSSSRNSSIGVRESERRSGSAASLSP